MNCNFFPDELEANRQAVEHIGNLMRDRLVMQVQPMFVVYSPKDEWKYTTSMLLKSA